MARKANGVSTVRRLHRILGVATAVFLLWMAASGILINHSDALGLATRHVSSPALLDWYGLRGPERISSFRVGSGWLSFTGTNAYFDGEEITTLAGGRGAVRTESMLVAAGNRELLLLDHEARLLERVPWLHGETIDGLGTSDGRVVARTGEQTWVADEQLLVWRELETPSAPVQWSLPETAPMQVKERLAQSYRGGVLSLQRVLLDIHSGRIFGEAGIWVYDLLGLATIVIAMSGLLLWLRTGRRPRR